jgi:hypothetical protein
MVVPSHSFPLWLEESSSFGSDIFEGWFRANGLDLAQTRACGLGQHQWFPHSDWSPSRMAGSIFLPISSPS